MLSINNKNWHLVNKINYILIHRNFYEWSKTWIFGVTLFTKLTMSFYLLHCLVITRIMQTVRYTKKSWMKGFFLYLSFIDYPHCTCKIEDCLLWHATKKKKLSLWHAEKNKNLLYTLIDFPPQNDNKWGLRVHNIPWHQKVNTLTTQYTYCKQRSPKSIPNGVILAMIIH